MTSHTGILTLIKEAKDKGHAWADSALGEISLLTQIEYQFSRNVTFDMQQHTIIVRK